MFWSKESLETRFYTLYKINFWIIQLQSFHGQFLKYKMYVFQSRFVGVHVLVLFTDCASHLQRCWQGFICPLYVYGQWVWAPNWSRFATEVCFVWNSNAWGQSSCEASSKKCKSQQLSIFSLLLIYNLI